MNKCNQIYGVDISKDVFDVADSAGKHYQFSNDSNGFKSFLKSLSDQDLVVMEATGYYHYRLAQFLYEQGVKVSVVNPLSVKRFIQMKLSKIKTDKSDARAICEYATVNEVPLYTAKDENQAESLQLLRLIEIYTKQSTALKNKLHGEKVLGKPSKAVYHSLNRSLKAIQREIKVLEDRLTVMVKEEQQNQLSLLKSIPGMGNKTAIMLLVLTDGFSNFENARQLCCYAGITPTIRESGASVRGRSRISKMGNAKLRNLLFMCSFTACKHNKACREIYERIIAKGKSKKLALIAVCNKLLKQAFAVAKSGLPYDENYVSKLG
ncbi:Transposase [Salinimicrobium catena]|uniref:Transposase n=1 Tax=Salinimicrobium catena TaxID=390640 RepID=A0A1H5MMX6_9FLAO|nr:IS110 family transposase [Salinimicrobium catena]SDL26440.1 Transposase [Salinimicrobium catena]SDL73621.1 Transposase [Salinimicrobium catena]SDL84134.1 Transposase [Salinimicrobium catena]SDL86416.1 Transposase [Salinimicrobium catena]SEE90709.1 Transposase [Salinimicrobium catena]